MFVYICRELIAPRASWLKGGACGSYLPGCWPSLQLPWPSGGGPPTNGAFMAVKLPALEGRCAVPVRYGLLYGTEGGRAG